MILLIGAKTNDFKPAPNVGRMTRSPQSVLRMIQMAWYTSCSYETTKVDPSPAAHGGNDHPTPRNALAGLTVGAAVELPIKLPVELPAAMILPFSQSLRVDHYSGASHRDRVRRSYLHHHVSHASRRQSPNHHGHAALSDHSSDVRHEHGHKRAGVEIGPTAPRGHPADENRGTAGARAEWRSVTG